jgi:FtsX-like permease family protein
LLSYALKRIVRSWRLFVALVLGMVLAATFFGGINVGADTVGKQALDQQLQATPFDLRLQPYAYNSATVPSSKFAALAATVSQVNGVLRTEVLGQTQDTLNYTLPQVMAIPDNSALYSHMVISGSLPAHPNETLVSSLSTLSGAIKVGDTITYHLNQYGNAHYNLTLRVVGTARLDSVATNTFFPGFGGFFGINRIPGQQQTIAIVSWDETFTKLQDWAYQTYTSSGSLVNGVSAYLDVYLDRSSLISSSDVSGSAARVTQVEARIANVASGYGFTNNDYVLSPLQTLAPTILTLRISFTVFSVPVFFMAWYVGRTVSQASYNLRRREIGLLMTKGFSKGQLFRHFLSEALIVGLASGILGLALAFALNPVFTQALGGSITGSAFLSRDTAIITVIFTVILTLLAVLSPAREASNMDPAQSLREYVYLEDVKPTRRRFAILAFGLGLYKIILLSLGVNFAVLSKYAFAGGVLFAIVITLMSILDFALTFIGPFLFLYGATQLSSGWSLRFHKLFSNLFRRLIGDIASLASKSVFRNPRRVTSLVFLVALILGYSLWVVGDLASMEDFNARQAEVRVGSDLRISNVGSNASMIADKLRTWGNVTGTTTETSSQFNAAGIVGTITLKGIDPATWKQGAFYEPEWFSSNLDGLLQTLQANSHTVILDRGLASYLDVRQGANLTISTSLNLTVVGFFGPDYTQVASPGLIIGGFQGFSPIGWSYIPQSVIGQFPQLFSTSNSTLVKASSAVDLSSLSRSIQTAFPSTTVETAQQPTEGAGAIITNGLLNVLRLGTVFAAAAACIGVGTVSYTGFKEREKETTIIAVRGLPYRRLLGLLVAEVLPLVVFALILAGAVGLITVRGDALASSAQTFGLDYYLLLAPRRVVFPLWSLETIGLVIGLLFLGVLVPALGAARKNLAKMSRTVRFA